MKVLIFENEIHEAIDAFKDVNYLDFNNQIEFNWFTKSQDFTNFNELAAFGLIFVDIDLSTKSQKDGYGIISELIEHGQKDKIVILTGIDVNNKLKELKLEDIPVVEKPIFHSKLKTHFKSALQKSAPKA